MIIARIEFKPEFASQFCDGENQRIVETAFSTVTELIATVEEFKPYITECVSIVGSKVVSLRAVSGL